MSNIFDHFIFTLFYHLSSQELKIVFAFSNQLNVLNSIEISDGLQKDFYCLEVRRSAYIIDIHIFDVDITYLK